MRLRPEALQLLLDGVDLRGATLRPRYEGRAGVAAGLGLPGLNVEAETARGRGLREEFTYQFANVQDLSAYLAGNREVAGLEQTPEVVAPGQFTAAARSSQFSLRTDEVAYTRPIGPGSRSTGGIGPGMRTTVAEMRSEMTRSANGNALLTDLYTLTTRPGLAKVGKTASRVELAVSRSQPAMGALTLEEASLNMDISLSKLKNVTSVGADADRALAVLAGKMTDRINETLGNSNQRGGNFSTEGTAATVNAALKQLQAQASSIEGGGGLSNPQTKSLLGLSWRSEDLATIRFTFNEVNGRLALGEPMVGMTSERELGFRLDFGLSEDTNLGHVHASAALTAWRQASDAPPPLMPAGSPAQGQEVRLARKHSQFFAARVTSEDGRSALQNPAVRLRIDPKLFLPAVQSDAREPNVQSVEAHLLRHLNKVVSVSGRTEKVEELSNGIDVERSRAAIRGALSLIRGSSAALTANQDQARFTVAYEALQTRIEEGTVEMDYRLECSDVDGRWSLVNPATDQATLDRLVRQRGDRVDANPVRSPIAGAADTAAVSPAVSLPAAPALTPGTTEVATKGALIATATGDRTLLESRFETNETDFLAAVAPDAGSISPRARLATKFANRMVNDILPKASTEGRGITMDRATTREGMTRILDFLSANHDEIRTALASSGRTFSRDGVTVERQPGGFMSRDRVRVTIPLQQPIFPSGDVSANHILATPVSTANEI